MNSYVGGVIFHPEMLTRRTRDGVNFLRFLTRKGVITITKVDEGTVTFNGSGEEYTKGLEGLGDRLDEYFDRGSDATKWRSVFSVGDGLPTDELLDRNSSDLAQYALAVQARNRISVVEPEVYFTLGTHDIDAGYKTTVKVLKHLFEVFDKKDVDFSRMILKTNMVVPSVCQTTPNIPSANTAAQWTLRASNDSVPEEVAAIHFLSGGIPSNDAIQYSAALHVDFPDAPWARSISYGRGLRDLALRAYALHIKDPTNNPASDVQDGFLTRFVANSLALEGIY